MQIRRDIYLDRLIARKRNGMAKVITGVRRSGKSFLMNELFYQHLIGHGVDNPAARAVVGLRGLSSGLPEGPGKLKIRQMRIRKPRLLCEPVDLLLGI